MPKGNKGHALYTDIEYSCECGLSKLCKTEKEHNNYERLHSKFCKKALISDTIQSVTKDGRYIKRHVFGLGKVI
jgi:hypothetical protein